MFIFLASHLILKCTKGFNANETERYTLVLSPDKEEATIIPLCMFHGFSSLLVPLIIPCPSLANKPICSFHSFVKYKLLDPTTLSCF